MSNSTGAGAVNALTLYNGQLIAAGSFTSAGGVACSNVASWNGSTWQPLDGGITGGTASTLTVYNNQLFAGGVFTTAGGVTCSHIARWNGSAWQAVSGGITNSTGVYGLGVYNGQLIASGSFATAGGVPARYIARWDESGWQSMGTWAIGTNYYVDSQAVYNGQLIVGGNFLSAGGVACNFIARWDGANWRALDSGMNSNVRALLAHNDQLVAGGNFTTAGGKVCNYIASRNKTSTWQPMGSGMNGTVYALALYNDQVIAAGAFTTAGGATCNRIARWDGSAWQPLGTGLGNTVYALTLYNNQLVAAGGFTTAGGVAAKYIASWNGSAWQPLDGGMNNSVAALTVYNNQLVAGGSFTTAGSVAAKYIASWNGTAWQPLDGGMNNSVTALTAWNGQLVAGGSFSTAGSTTCYSVARWDGTAWQPLDGGTNGSVSALVVYNGQLVAAGPFGGAGGITARTVSTWDGTAWQPMAGGLDTASYALAVYNGHLVVGGAFQGSYDGKVSAYWARWGPVMPTILQQPVSQTVVLGNPATFSIEAIGSGTLSYQWRKDGTDLSGDTSAILTIDAVAVQDDGIYECVVTNAAGSTTSNAAILTVKIPATIVTQPTSQAVQAGQSVTFTVEAIGSDTLSYQWRKAGVPLVDDARLSGSTSSTLTIAAVEVADTDAYDVVVTNPWGTATSEAATITVLPTILQQPASQAILLGQPVTLSVSAVGSGTLSYQWRKNGVDITGANAATFSIDTVTASDDASYDVVVTSEYGTITSDAATVVVNLPPTIITQPVSQAILLGQPVTLSVIATGSGTLSYQWSKGGVALNDDGRILGSTTNTLTINPSQADDTGSYDVVVTSEYGTITSDTVVVTINLPPTIAAQPTSQAVQLGNPLTLSVTAAGSGTLTYQWRKDGVDIAGANTASLTIEAVTASDGASYDVVVISEYGTITSDAAVVTINLPPTIATQPVNQAILLGQPATLSVIASGSGTLAYQWRKDGNPISGATSTPLTIDAVTTADAGAYDVVVTSEYGTVTSNAATVVVNLPATIVTQPVSQSVGAGGTVTLSVEASGSGTLAYQWRKGGVDILGATSSMLVLNAVTSADAGTYDIVVTSQYGTVTSQAATITVADLNTAPVVTITGPTTGHVQAVNTNLTLAATVSDSDANDTHTATWTLHDDYLGDRVIAGTISGTNVQNVIQLADAGIYHISLTVTDSAGAAVTATIVNNDPTMPAFVVIYDPSCGHVTGGGWIISPAGALKWIPGGVALNAEGKATFGFNAKYKKGATVPAGNTEFQFKGGNFKFKSTDYEWLVVTGNKAQYKGWGEIHGLPGTYAFTLTAVDSNGGDRFRIKIWDEATDHVIYDNKRGQNDDADPTLIDGGSIQIHQ